MHTPRATNHNDSEKIIKQDSQVKDIITGYTNKLKSLQAAPKFIGKTSPRQQRAGIFKKPDNVVTQS